MDTECTSGEMGIGTKGSGASAYVMATAPISSQTVISTLASTDMEIRTALASTNGLTVTLTQGSSLTA